MANLLSTPSEKYLDNAGRRHATVRPMKKRDAIKHFGTGAAVADALGIRPQAVNKWGDIVPYARAVQLRKITRGKLKTCDKDYHPSR